MCEKKDFNTSYIFKKYVLVYYIRVNYIKLYVRSILFVLVQTSYEPPYISLFVSYQYIQTPIIDFFTFVFYVTNLSLSHNIFYCHCGWCKAYTIFSRKNLCLQHGLMQHPCKWIIIIIIAFMTQSFPGFCC